MKDNRIYEPASAADLYKELQETYKLAAADYLGAYKSLKRIFLYVLNQNTNIAGVRFGGPFAQADYLLKEHRAPRHLHLTVNDARSRFGSLSSKKATDLEDNFPYDFKAICQFVSLVYHAPIPSALKAVFPQSRRVKRGELKAECIRVIVNSWDDTFIYGISSEESIGYVTVFYGGKSEWSVFKGWDWSYLKPILKESTQLNLVRPREHEGVLYPELIILEPDFLVDISAIASCFETYAVSPLVHLLNKIKPAPNSSAIILGNLASQFLDEGLSQDTEATTYEQSVSKFFKRNTIPLLTASLDKDFHDQARKQRENINETLKTTLPKILHNDGIKMDTSEIMVEPSFFYEMLGIQGRMDFLHLDYKVLIEQKSGKGAFVFGGNSGNGNAADANAPKHQEKHYVQLLLYMLLIRYNFRSTYEGNEHKLFSFLLYSKYPNGLLPLGFASELIFSALKVRNEIVANEYIFTNEGFDLLKDFNSNWLSPANPSNKLWQVYQKPQIDSLLSPISKASELERSYYLRFLKFIETEHLMSKVGNQTKENSGFADKWHSTLEDKQLAGNIYCDLDMHSPSSDYSGKVERIVLSFTEKPDHDISNFRPGDIVVLYPYAEGAEPDVRKTMVFRSTIESITSDKITLMLRAAQVDARVFWHHGKQKWAIEHDFFESSYGSLYRGMHAFLSAPQERRDLLLLQREAETDKSLTLSGSYGSFDELSLRVKQAKDLFLIIGPPGTGKTSFGLLNTLREELLSTDSSILLLSYTNRAVDEICSKLVEDGIDFIRIGSQFSCEEALRPYLLCTKVEKCANIGQVRNAVTSTRVFVGTTSAINSNVNIFDLKQFNLAIIDEASQILEPHLIGLLSAKTAEGTSAIRKIVMIGDHKQLPAVVQQNEEESEVSDPALRSIHLTNCRLSMFERLLKHYRNNADVTYMLTKQGRMHHDIAEFPNENFYDDMLSEVPLPHQNIPLPPVWHGTNGIEDILMTRRVVFVAIPKPNSSASDRVNTNEARAIAATVARIYENAKEEFSPLQTVGVIVPYRNQIAEVRSQIETYGIADLNAITIDTVERYQGSQRDYIIYGFTVQKPHQLSFLTSNVFEEDGNIIDRKLNVAMTRSRKGLILFGNPELLSKNIIFSKLMEYAKSRHSYISISLDDYVSGNFQIESIV